MQQTLFYFEKPKQKEKYKSKYLKFKGENNYRKAENKEKCCKTCKHLTANIYNGRGQGFHKCELLGLSHSSATDIRISYVCNQFKGREERG